MKISYKFAEKERGNHYIKHPLLFTDKIVCDHNDHQIIWKVKNMVITRESIDVDFEFIPNLLKDLQDSLTVLSFWHIIKEWKVNITNCSLSNKPKDETVIEDDLDKEEIQ